MASEAPRMDMTAVSHWPRLVAPLPAGLYCTVSRPIPVRRSVFAQRTLQLRQVQRRLAGSPCSSWPSACPTSTLRLEPHRAQVRGPGGGQALARYRSALSLTTSLRQRCPSAGWVSPTLRRPRPRLPLPLPGRQSRRLRRADPASPRSPPPDLRPVLADPRPAIRVRQLFYGVEP